MLGEVDDEKAVWEADERGTSVIHMYSNARGRAGN